MAKYITRDGKELAIPEPQDRGKNAEDVSPDPIQDARKLRKQLIADAMVDSELAKARAETAEAKSKASKAEAESEKRENPPESPFKFTGEFNMGKFDFQKQLQDAQADQKRMREEAEQQARDQGRMNDDLRDRLHQKEMDIIQLGLQAQIQESNKRLEQLMQQNASKKSFLDEYNEALELSNKLGLSQPQMAGDAKIQVELKKMDFDHQLEMRRFAREEKRSDREFQLALRRFDDERIESKARIEEERKRSELFPKALESVGRSIAAGMMDAEVGGGPAPQNTSALVSKHHIEAHPGEAGTFNCPNCKTEVGMGPKSPQAVCANCGTVIPIKRVSLTSEHPSSVHRQPEEQGEPDELEPVYTNPFDIDAPGDFGEEEE